MIYKIRTVTAVVDTAVHVFHTITILTLILTRILITILLTCFYGIYHDVVVETEIEAKAEVEVEVEEEVVTQALLRNRTHTQRPMTVTRTVCTVTWTGIEMESFCLACQVSHCARRPAR